MSRPQTYGSRVTSAIRLEPDLHARLHAAADERDVSANWLITRAIEQLLDRIGDTEPIHTPTPAVMAPESNGHTERGWLRRSLKRSLT